MSDPEKHEQANEHEPVKEEDIPSWSGWGPGGMGLPLEAYGDPLNEWDLDDDEEE